MDAQQNLDVVRPDVVRPDEMHLLGVVVDAELRHQLKMDYFRDVVGEEQRHQLKMDYFQVEVQVQQALLLKQ